jgi:hypothetical protein
MFSRTERDSGVERGREKAEGDGIEAREHLPYTAYGRADGADVRPSSSPNRMAGLSVSLALQQELDMVVLAWRPFVGPEGTELSDMQQGSAAPDGAVALHANRCRRAARGRRAAARARACETRSAQKVVCWCSGPTGRENPTKVGFHAFGIALASNSAIIVRPQLRAKLVSDLPPATVDYALTSER